MNSPSDTPVQFLKGVGPARAKLFLNLGVQTVEDLLYLFPRRYEDRRKLTPVGELKAGEWQTTQGEVIAKGGRRTFWNKKHVFEITVADDSGRVRVIWFNQPYLENYFHVGDHVVLHGRVEIFKEKLQIVAPEYEIISEGDEGLNTGRIVPIYPLTRGMGQRYLRKIVNAALERHANDLVDVVPEDVRRRQNLKALAESITQLHFPDDEKAQDAASKRVSFEEFFLFQVSVILRRMSIVQKKGFEHFIPAGLHERFARAFPFELTKAQKKAIAEISCDMAKPMPMLRLLQGDVGSGKTVVSFFGCMASVTNGRQAAIMAPTEVLAEQHYATFTKYFGQGAGSREQGNEEPQHLSHAPCSVPPAWSVRVAILNSSLKKKEREATLKKIKAGEIDVVVGTHALLEEGVEFKQLSFVCVDEQHKFGVKQRALLSAKGENPDVLVMTATPIPRTLCLTLYGDLDLSVIDEKPKGRGQIKTYHFTGEQAEGVYKRVAEWVRKGTQAYIVYPIIDPSSPFTDRNSSGGFDAAGEKADLKAAVAMYERFRKEDFKNFRVGLIHGRLKRDEARKVMEEFKAGAIDILVTTTVLEVGIDVPSANVMVIEHAERFGLSQLHQLRGRIGRSEKSAVCILLGDPETEEGKKRIEAVVKTTNGFKISEHDLEIRGPGQYFGRHQHGLNELRVVNPLTQIDVLEVARKEASALVKADPSLVGYPLVKTTIRRRYPEYLERVLAG